MDALQARRCAWRCRTANERGADGCVAECRERSLDCASMCAREMRTSKDVMNLAPQQVTFALFMHTSEMKFLQIALVLALLVASTYALSCNVGSSGGGTATTCAAQDFGAAADTCYSCTMTASGGVAAYGCLAASSCITLKAACTSNYKSCTSANCNSCSPASVLQVSAAFIFSVVAAMLF